MVLTEGEKAVRQIEDHKGLGSSLGCIKKINTRYEVEERISGIK